MFKEYEIVSCEISKDKEEERGWKRATSIHKAKDNDLRTVTHVESSHEERGSSLALGGLAVKLSIQGRMI